LWKRTNFEIPNEINAVRVPCRGGPGMSSHRSDGIGAGFQVFAEDPAALPWRRQP
jgi:hypothetical protein